MSHMARWRPWSRARGSYGPNSGSWTLSASVRGILEHSRQSGRASHNLSTPENPSGSTVRDGRSMAVDTCKAEKFNCLVKKAAEYCSWRGIMFKPTKGFTALLILNAMTSFSMAAELKVFTSRAVATVLHEI